MPIDRFLAGTIARHGVGQIVRRFMLVTDQIDQSGLRISYCYDKFGSRIALVIVLIRIPSRNFVYSMPGAT